MMQVTTYDDPAAPPAPAHAVLVCMPTQGHINPFISIATYLAACGIHITLIGSAHLHSLLSYAQDSSTLPQSRKAEMRPIRIEVVPDGMPADHTQAVPVSSLVESISIIRKGVEAVLERLMQEEQPPGCLIIDDLLALWGQDVAVKFNLPWMILWTSSVFCFSVCFHIPELLARGYIPAIGEGSKETVIDFIPGLSPFCIKDLPKPINVEEDPRNHPMFKFFSDTVKHADRLLANSIYELESSAVEALRKEAGFRVDPVGPLYMMSSLSTASNSYAVSLLQEDKGCLSWLDEQQESSVLYIAFGSVASTDDNVVIELAYALEASGLNFLWVIRPNALSGNASVQELLPEGFMERTHDRGRIISWAPQLAVLSHPSTGAFLTHCGWNSILESLCNGVPMLGFPQEAEQNTNLKFIVDDGKVGLPLLQPNVQQVERLHVQCAMTAIMQGEEGIELRKRALSIKDIALKAVHGSSKSTLIKLVDDLKSGHLKAPNVPQFQGIEKGP